MASTLKMVGGAAAAAAVGALVLRVLRRYPRKGPALFRLGFAVAVGVGAYWQEKHRMRELAEHLRVAGYLSPGFE
jgi:hypothetical protein